MIVGGGRSRCRVCTAAEPAANVDDHADAADRAYANDHAHADTDDHADAKDYSCIDALFQADDLVQKTCRSGNCVENVRTSIKQRMEA